MLYLIKQKAMHNQVKWSSAILTNVHWSKELNFCAFRVALRRVFQRKLRDLDSQVNVHSKYKCFRPSWKAQPCTMLALIPWYWAKIKNKIKKVRTAGNGLVNWTQIPEQTLSVYSCYCSSMCILPLYREYVAVTTRNSLSIATRGRVRGLGTV